MKAVILAGGLGSRISEETNLKPKPMIEIGGKPILWHIMKIYAASGVQDFVICCGYKGYVIKEYFANYFLHMSDVTFDMVNNRMEVHHKHAEPWRVTLVDTGDESMTGGRLRRVASYLHDEEAFCFTYGDGVADVDIAASIAFHRAHGKLATVTAVAPPGRYGALQLDGDAVRGFAEKPRGDGGMINGGFFVLSPRVIERIAGDATPWEAEPLTGLARDGELMAWPHTGFWQPMDTLREKNLLEELWQTGRAPLEDLVMRPNPDFWRGRRVLLTGHTGFKGAWLALWLARLGARVTGLALPPASTPNLYTLGGVAARCDSRLGDIRQAEAVEAAVEAARPEIVLHLAAQALVRAGYRMPLDTLSTNVMGTAQVLDALRQADGVRAVVVVTTDKVYRNHETPWPYREDDALGGHDPYSASKAAAEIVAACYRDAFLAERGVAVATARAGNVIGGGDWSEDRLIPDAVRAWQAGATLQVRRPDAVRPWQHVLEPLAAYLRLAEVLWQEPAKAGAYNFGPRTHEAATVREVLGIARPAFGRGELRFDELPQGPHEAGWLALEVAKARTALGIEARWSLQEAVQRTMDWYKAQAAGADAAALCEADMLAFEGRR